MHAFVCGCAQRGAQLAEAHGAYYFETSAKDDIGVLCCAHAVLILEPALCVGISDAFLKLTQALISKKSVMN